MANFYLLILQQGMTPIDLAVEKRNSALIRLLRKNFTKIVPSPPQIFTEDSSSNHSGGTQQQQHEKKQKIEEKTPLIQETLPTKTNTIHRGSDQKR